MQIFEIYFAPLQSDFYNLFSTLYMFMQYENLLARFILSLNQGFEKYKRISERLVILKLLPVILKCQWIASFQYHMCKKRNAELRNPSNGGNFFPLLTFRVLIFVCPERESKHSNSSAEYHSKFIAALPQTIYIQGRKISNSIYNYVRKQHVFAGKDKQNIQGTQ